MPKVYLLLGSNVGDRTFYLKMAIEKIKKLYFGSIKISPIYETKPWGVTKQLPYYNLAIEMDFPQKPFSLLNKLKNIEKQLGRKNKGNYLPRTIDIDIILWGEMILHSKKLTIPHPRMQDRNFVLIPLLALNEQAKHPIFQKNIADLQKNCNDTLEVKKLGF